MHTFKSLLLALTLCTLIPVSIEAKSLPVTSPEKVSMNLSILTTVDEAINSAITSNRTPGAVLLVAHQGKVVYKKAYGNRMMQPRIENMTLDTIFDMASLTKPTATGTGIMILAQEGKLNINDKVSKYIPDFGQKGKENITIAQLLTHTSGLKPGGYYTNKQLGYDGIIKDIVSMSTSYAPGTKFSYSDLGFITLGEIIRRVSGKPENVFVAERIFKPLGMTETGYLPSKSIWDRCAPTEFRNGKWLQGEVHDPTAAEMGGISGNAGIFSTADDMAIFCQMFLNNGQYNHKRILTPESVKLMTTNQSEVTTSPRGFGWDIGSAYSSQRGKVFPKAGFGHTGWTGTSVWVDPASQTFVILLCNRNHPTGKGDVTKLRSQVSTIVAKSIYPKETWPEEATSTDSTAK